MCEGASAAVDGVRKASTSMDASPSKFKLECLRPRSKARYEKDDDPRPPGSCLRRSSADVTIVLPQPMLHSTTRASNVCPSSSDGALEQVDA